MSHKADAKRLADQLKEEGFNVKISHGGHWEVRDADGRRVCTFAQTPSDRRWRQNALGDIRRWKRSRGIPVEQQRLEAVMITVNVVPGDTLSGIAEANNVSLSSVEAANPQIENPNLIYVGQKVLVPSGGSYSSWTPGPSSASSPSSSGSPSSLPSSTSSGGSSSGGLGDVPGVPQSFATCVAQAESSDNPTAVNSVPGYIGNGGGAYGFLTATWNNFGGYHQPFNAPVSVQKAAFSALYKTNSGYPWVADGCPQKLLGEK